MRDPTQSDTSVPPANDESPRTTTEVTLVDGSRYQVEGDARSVERTILDAARGSLMALAWLTEAESGEELGINPEMVVMLRIFSSSRPAA